MRCTMTTTPKTQQPKESLYPSGPSERTLERLRLSMVILALIDVAAHVYASPGATPLVSYWIDIETATYSLIAVIYLLGLRR